MNPSQEQKPDKGNIKSKSEGGATKALMVVGVIVFCIIGLRMSLPELSQDRGEPQQPSTSIVAQTSTPSPKSADAKEEPEPVEISIELSPSGTELNTMLDKCLEDEDGVTLRCRGLKLRGEELALKGEAVVKRLDGGVSSVEPIQLAEPVSLPNAPDWRVQGDVTLEGREVLFQEAKLTAEAKRIVLGTCNVTVGAGVELKCSQIREMVGVSGHHCVLNADQDGAWSGGCEAVRVPTQEEHSEALKGDVRLIGFPDEPTLVAKGLKEIPLGGGGTHVHGGVRTRDDAILVEAPRLVIPEEVREESVLNLPSEVEVEEFVLTDEADLRSRGLVSVGRTIDSSTLPVPLVQEFLEGLKSGLDVKSLMTFKRTGQIVSYEDNQVQLLIAGRSLVDLAAMIRDPAFEFAYDGPEVPVPIYAVAVGFSELLIGYDGATRRAKLNAGGSIGPVFKMLKNVPKAIKAWKAAGKSSALSKKINYMLDKVDGCLGPELQGRSEFVADIGRRTVQWYVEVSEKPRFKLTLSMRRIKLRILEDWWFLTDEWRNWSLEW